MGRDLVGLFIVTLKIVDASGLTLSITHYSGLFMLIIFLFFRFFFIFLFVSIQ